MSRVTLGASSRGWNHSTIPFSQHDRLQPHSALTASWLPPFTRQIPFPWTQDLHGPDCHISQMSAHTHNYPTWFSSSLGNCSLIRLAYHFYNENNRGQQSFTGRKAYVNLIVSKLLKPEHSSMCTEKSGLTSCWFWLFPKEYPFLNKAHSLTHVIVKSVLGSNAWHVAIQTGLHGISKGY